MVGMYPEEFVSVNIYNAAQRSIVITLRIRVSVSIGITNLGYHDT